MLSIRHMWDIDGVENNYVPEIQEEKNILCNLLLTVSEDSSRLINWIYENSTFLDGLHRNNPAIQREKIRNSFRIWDDNRFNEAFTEIKTILREAI